jgi:hypothetical protein
VARAGFDDQVFYLTGGIPQIGGRAILAAGLSRDDLTGRVAQDPFVVHGVATPEIIELDITMSDPTRIPASLTRTQLGDRPG